jgi:hypothetical protein
MIQKWIAISLTALSVLSISVRAQDAKPASVEDRLKTLEQELHSLRQENKQLRQELGVPPPPVKVAGPVKELKLGGYLQAQAEFGDEGDARWTGNAANDRFYLRRARLNASGAFLEHVDFRIELDLAGSLGEATGVRAQLTDGWANWNYYDFTNLKVGQFFPVFGWEKRLAPTKLQAIEYSLAGDRLLPDRQLGAQLWGGFLEKRISYALGVFNGNNLNNNWNDNENFMLVPRLEGVPLQGKLFGQPARWALAGTAYYSDDNRYPITPDLGIYAVANGYSGQTNVFVGQRTAAAFDTQLQIGRFDLWAEYLFTEYDPDGPADTFHAQGWYVLAGYYIVPKKLQALAKYEQFDPNTDVAGDATDTWTLGVSYALKGDNLKLYLNYLLMDVPGQEEWEQKLLLRLQAAF